MAYKCIRCERIIAEEDMANGCKCGSKMFFEDREGKNGKVNEEINYDGRIENVTVVNKGIFELDLKSISDDFVIVKDEKGVYYVKLPYMAQPSHID